MDRIKKFGTFVGECRVYNQTDGKYATSKKFKNEAAALKFIEEFRESFKEQGYYLTAKSDRIPPEDIELVIK